MFIQKIKELFAMRRLPFWSIVILVVILSVATFVEKANGSDFVYSHIYGTWWFCAVWGVVVILSIIGIVKGKMYNNIPLLLVHASFIVILIGALCTKLTAQHGYMILNKGVANNLVKADTDILKLDFEVKLDTFYIAYYPGTNAPADYVSRISISDQRTNDSLSAMVSMNNIYSYDGYRFYQTSFEDDWQTSVLSVNHDVWGIALTYIGYGLFMLSMLWYLWSPQNAFRKLLANPLLKKVGMLLLLGLPLSVTSQTITPDGLTVTRSQADKFGSLWMLYDGKITPVATFAHDFTLKLTGKTSFSYLNSNQFLMSFLFFPNKWEQVALFKIEDPELKKLLNAESENAALQDFFDSEGTYKLAKYFENQPDMEMSKTPKQKEIVKLNDKIQLINMLHGGSLLQLYPITVNGRLKWYYPTQNLRLEQEQEHIDMIRNSLFSYYKALTANDDKSADAELEKIAEFQKKNAGNILPSEFHRNVELIYLKTDFTSILFMSGFTLGILALILNFSLPDKKQRAANKIFYFALLACFLIHTYSIFLRTYIGGRLPFSNGFETMLIIAWFSMLIALLFGRRMPVVIPFGFLISGCSLLVAHLGMMNPKITPLVPVLSSPLLSIHVSVIMIAYTLLAFVALNSLVSLIQILVSRKGRAQTTIDLLERNKVYSQLCLYPAIFFLGAGIFIGAVWANISWGRYWGWDPKEVWALITFLIYSLIFHEKNIKIFTNTFTFHVFGFLSFSSVLMTYFGVNYFLGGMHSYAGEIQFDKTGIILVVSVLAALLLVVASYRKYRTISPKRD
ncbi:MAG: cytochrome c biogenesis protein CcsA [Dysgonomonas sp.]